MRGGGLPRLVIPGFRDIRGYQAMYRDFVRAIREQRTPEMSLERAMDDQRLMEQAYANAPADCRRCRHSDAAGTLRRRRHRQRRRRRHARARAVADPRAHPDRRARRLHPAGRTRTGIPEAVWKHLRYQTREVWLDANGREFPPYSHYNVGGNSKFWGSVLYRLRREDFQDLKHLDGLSPAWPIDYDTLEPYYDRAERLYQVHGEAGSDPTDPRRGPYPYPPVPHSAGMATHRRTVPMRSACIRRRCRSACSTAASCATPATRSRARCTRRAKRTSAASGRRSSSRRSRLWTNATATRLLTNASGDRVEAVEVERQRRDRPRRGAPVRRRRAER